MKTELPADVSFHPGPRLMVYRPRGILTEGRLQAVVDFLEKVEDKAAKPFHRFTDLSKLDALDLEFKSVIRISLHRRLTYAQHAPIKSAFYVTSPAAARVVKVHVLLTDHSPLKVKMFQELGLAAKWLDVSINLLQAEGAPTNGG
jgi:hypothetical protein